MENISWIALASRWVHLVAMAVAIGASLYVRLALLPAATATLTTDQLASLKAALTKRWAKVIHTGVALLLLTGFYNFMLAIKSQPSAPYQMLFGFKFLLALAVFALAILLNSSKPRQWIEKRRSTWITLFLLLAALVVALSVILKNLPRAI